MTEPEKQADGCQWVLRVSDAKKTFEDGTAALKGVRLEVRRGEFVVVLGPSGAGKTTLLRSIIGLERLTAGEVRLDGAKVEPSSLAEVRSKVGMIFQGFNLIDNLSALNNVLSGLLDTRGNLATLFYVFKRSDKLRALQCLDQVGLLDKAYSAAGKLSGGQRQRVGVARALIRQPRLLLADEPVASLDPMIAFTVLSLIKEICAKQGIAVICNLHQVDLALRFADRIVGLSDGRVLLDEKAGAINQDYIREIYAGHGQGMYFGAGDAPSDEFVHLDFLGSGPLP
ncbi:MAG: phosphonate ABC transporter ATP-binding protein [Proteobacteria bacterium]|nr:phosphonate ABC transporter ATP-binding protein [Pseudomonadota bacterium]